MTASDWGPDSPALSRFRAFYDQPAPVEFECFVPGDVDGPEDERQYLLDEAPFANLSAVRVERVALPSSSAAPGRTPVPEGDKTPEERTGDLRAEQDQIKDRRRHERELAAVMDPAAFDDMATIPTARRRERQLDALVFASSAISAGYRLVSEDDATVDRVAGVLRDRFGGEVPGYGQTVEFWRGPAHAAVRALRNGGGDE